MGTFRQRVTGNTAFFAIQPAQSVRRGSFERSTKDSRHRRPDPWSASETRSGRSLHESPTFDDRMYEKHNKKMWPRGTENGREKPHGRFEATPTAQEPWTMDTEMVDFPSISWQLWIFLSYKLPGSLLGDFKPGKGIMYTRKHPCKHWESFNLQNCHMEQLYSKNWGLKSSRF